MYIELDAIGAQLSRQKKGCQRVVWRIVAGASVREIERAIRDLRAPVMLGSGSSLDSDGHVPPQSPK